MTFAIRPAEYSYANVRDELGASYRVFSQLAERGVNLLAFTAVPAGPSLAQFALFPETPAKLVEEARAAGLSLDGPHHALLVQGDDELGAFASVTSTSSRSGAGSLLICSKTPANRSVMGRLTGRSWGATASRDVIRNPLRLIASWSTGSSRSSSPSPKAVPHRGGPPS
jgi:hypothetical protein